MNIAASAFRQKGRLQTTTINDLKILGVSEQIINAAKELVEKEKAAERQKRNHRRVNPEH
jgi:hypothetical protein